VIYLQLLLLLQLLSKTPVLPSRFHFVLLSNKSVYYANSNIDLHEIFKLRNDDKLSNY